MSIEKKMALIIVDIEKENGEYVACIVKEGEKGYFTTDWRWGTDRQKAQKQADEYNAKMGITKKEAMRLTFQSMEPKRPQNKFNLPPDLYELVCEKAGTPTTFEDSLVTFEEPMNPEDPKVIYDILLQEIEIQAAGARGHPEEVGRFPTIMQCALILEYLRHGVKQQEAQGIDGQDRKGYTDTQDRENYTEN
ncbi:Uncharacterised protein [uncultured archaeon]|nr:Uncharacterised protein [uncultured archaeon]